MDDGHGLFFPQRLLEYAEAYLVNKKAKTPDTGDAMTNQLRRVKADADNKEALAARNKLKLEVEQGLLIEKEKHELSLAARAAFLKREVETLGLRLGQDIIALVGGDPSRLDDFIGFWKDKTETWLDTWSKDQEFTVDLDLETLTPGLLTSGRRPIGQRGRPRGAPNKKVGAEDK
jgi:hypothetical protein